MELSDFASNQSKQILIDRIEQSIRDNQNEATKPSGQSLEFKVKEEEYATGKNREYKDALNMKHVIAYAFGHLTNDLVIVVWNTYSAWYLNKCIMLSDYQSGLVVLVGQIIDAIAQPLIGYFSDNIDTRIGKRMPWYLIGHVFIIPCFYMIFNPPDLAIGDNESNPKPNLFYFLLVPGIMNIG